MNTDERNKSLPIVKVRVGDDIVNARYDKENNRVFLEDGRIVKINGSLPESQAMPQKPQPAPGIQKPQNASDRRNQAEERMKQREMERQKGRIKAGSDEDVIKEKRKKNDKHESRNQRKLDEINRKRQKKEEQIAKKIADRESKQRKKMTGDAGGYEPRTQSSKKFRTTVAYILVIALLLVGAKLVLTFQAKEVAVCTITKDMLAGEVIQEGDVQRYSMLQKTFNELSANSPIIKWEDAEKIKGYYIANYIQKGQYLTKKNVTQKKVTRNPWLSDVGTDQEVYTLPIETDGIDTRLLVPGCSLRVRLVVQDENGSRSSKRDSSNQVAGENDLDVRALAGSGTAIPSATVIFPQLTVVDMLNDKNESIFDIYMALYKLSVEERQKYLETTIVDNDSALNFQKRITPNNLVLILDSNQASRMAEFENLEDAIIKYTILPIEGDGDTVLSVFTEIANQLNDIIGDYSVSPQEGAETTPSAETQTPVAE